MIMMPFRVPWETVATISVMSVPNSTYALHTVDRAILHVLRDVHLSARRRRLLADLDKHHVGANARVYPGPHSRD